MPRQDLPDIGNAASVRTPGFAPVSIGQFRLGRRSPDWRTHCRLGFEPVRTNTVQARAPES